LDHIWLLIATGGSFKASRRAHWCQKHALRLAKGNLLITYTCGIKESKNTRKRGETWCQQWRGMPPLRNSIPFGLHPQDMLTTNLQRQCGRLDWMKMVYCTEKEILFGAHFQHHLDPFLLCMDVWFLS
jgi:hypothetical protein